MITISGLSARNAAPTTSPPRNSEPVSPMKTLAGYALYTRNPVQLPSISAETAARDGSVLPVKNAAAPLAQTDKIVMYGDGNATKMVKDVMHTTSQIIDGMKESTGIDLQALLTGLVAGKTAANTVNGTPESAPSEEAGE